MSFTVEYMATIHQSLFIGIIIGNALMAFLIFSINFIRKRDTNKTRKIILSISLSAIFVFLSFVIFLGSISMAEIIPIFVGYPR